MENHASHRTLTLAIGLMLLTLGLPALQASAPETPETPQIPSVETCSSLGYGNVVEVDSLRVGPNESVVFQQATSIIADSVEIQGSLLGAPSPEPGLPGASLCIQADQLTINGLVCAGDGHDQSSLTGSFSSGSFAGQAGSIGGALTLIVPRTGVSIGGQAVLCSGSGGDGQEITVFPPSFQPSGICSSTPDARMHITGGAGGDAGDLSSYGISLVELKALGASLRLGDGGDGGDANLLYGNFGGGNATGGPGGASGHPDYPGGHALSAGTGGVGGDAIAVPCPDVHASGAMSSGLNLLEPKLQAVVEPQLLQAVCDLDSSCLVKSIVAAACSEVRIIKSESCIDPDPGQCDDGKIGVPPACRSPPDCVAPGVLPVECLVLLVLDTCYTVIFDDGHGGRYSACGLIDEPLGGPLMGEPGKSNEATGDTGAGGSHGEPGDDAGWRIIDGSGGVSAAGGAGGAGASVNFCKVEGAEDGFNPDTSPEEGRGASAGGGKGGDAYVKGGKGGSAHAQGGTGGDGGDGGDGGTGLIAFLCNVPQWSDGGDGKPGQIGADGGPGSAVGGDGGAANLYGGDGGTASGDGSRGGSGGNGGNGGRLEWDWTCNGWNAGACWHVENQGWAQEGRARCGEKGGQGVPTSIEGGNGGPNNNTITGSDGAHGVPTTENDVQGRQGPRGSAGTQGRLPDCGGGLPFYPLDYLGDLL